MQKNYSYLLNIFHVAPIFTKRPIFIFYLDSNNRAAMVVLRSKQMMVEEQPHYWSRSLESRIANKDTRNDRCFPSSLLESGTFIHLQACKLLRCSTFHRALWIQDQRAPFCFSYSLAMSSQTYELLSTSTLSTFPLNP